MECVWGGVGGGGAFSQVLGPSGVRRPEVRCTRPGFFGHTSHSGLRFQSGSRKPQAIPSVLPVAIGAQTSLGKTRGSLLWQCWPMQKTPGTVHRTSRTRGNRNSITPSLHTGLLGRLLVKDTPLAAAPEIALPWPDVFLFLF